VCGHPVLLVLRLDLRQSTQYCSKSLTNVDPVETPPLLNATLGELIEGLQSGTFTSVDLVKAYLHRIDEVDHEFHSVIETNPQALYIAHALDDERARHGPRGPLHGIPLLLKDNIVTLDEMNTTCGSYALVGAKPSEESEVVGVLRSAGVVILGKANMAEWSGFRSTSRCSGWSARGGQCTAPFWKGMKASGSSSGSAVATALGLGFAALGTEVCIIPDSFCLSTLEISS
jgi:amidase